MSVIETFSPEQESLLAAPLDASVIKSRPGGGGRQLKYISGDTAIDSANRIFGFGRWGYKIVARSHEVIEDEKKGRIEFYTADIELSVFGAAFPFPGDGIGIVNAPYTVEMHEKARKEATTDALKRALRHYGDQFGLCLYNEDDYVDAGDGTLVQVKEVQVNRQKQQPKRFVEASAAPKQIETPAKPSKERLNTLYNLAIRKKQIAKGVGAEDFLRVCARALNATITHPDQLTHSRLNAVEAWLNSIEEDTEQAQAS